VHALVHPVQEGTVKVLTPVYPWHNQAHILQALLPIDQWHAQHLEKPTIRWERMEGARVPVAVHGEAAVMDLAQEAQWWEHLQIHLQERVDRLVWLTPLHREDC